MLKQSVDFDVEYEAIFAQYREGASRGAAAA